MVISRGVADLHDLWFWSKKILSIDGKLFALKGGNINLEITRFKDEKVKIQCLYPKDDWKNYSNYLNEKFIIQIENAYG